MRARAPGLLLIALAAACSPAAPPAATPPSALETRAPRPALLPGLTLDLPEGWVDIADREAPLDARVRGALGDPAHAEALSAQLRSISSRAVVALDARAETLAVGFATALVVTREDFPVPPTIGAYTAHFTGHARAFAAAGISARPLEVPAGPAFLIGYERTLTDLAGRSFSAAVRHVLIVHGRSGYAFTLTTLRSHAERYEETLRELAATVRFRSAAPAP